jgi:hypothetical protein
MPHGSGPESAEPGTAPRARPDAERAAGGLQVGFRQPSPARNANGKTLRHPRSALEAAPHDGAARNRHGAAEGTVDGRSDGRGVERVDARITGAGGGRGAGERMDLRRLVPERGFDPPACARQRVAQPADPVRAEGHEPQP